MKSELINNVGYTGVEGAVFGEPFDGLIYAEFDTSMGQRLVGSAHADAVIILFQETNDIYEVSMKLVAVEHMEKNDLYTDITEFYELDIPEAMAYIIENTV